MERIIAGTTRPKRRPGFLAWLARLADRRRQHQALDRLSLEQLDDVGITEAQRRDELARRAWDVPAHWLR